MSDLYFFVSSILEKCEFKKKKMPFFWADTARLGIYGTGGYKRIGVYYKFQTYEIRVE